MFNLEGLSGWEIVALAGLCSVAWMGVASAIAGTVVWLVSRERAPAAHPVAVPKAVPMPAPARVPDYIPTTA
jgi:hypothetical protein